MLPAAGGGVGALHRRGRLGKVRVQADASKSLRKNLVSIVKHKERLIRGAKWSSSVPPGVCEHSTDQYLATLSRSKFRSRC
jgi:hypothetical protein